MKIYGIPNCDTVKKARKWLEAANVSYDFHDYKKLGADEAVLRAAIAAHGLDVVLNKRGTTWRKLGASKQAKAESVDGAVVLMLENPSIIKRPIAANGDVLLVGFNQEDWFIFKN